MKTLSLSEDLFEKRDSDKVSPKFALVHPLDFLKLSTGESVTKRLVFDRVKDVKELEDGYDIPFLRISVDSGRVLGHNGRHRAAVSYNDGVREYPCMIRTQSFSFETKEYEFVDDPVPKTLKGQFKPLRLVSTENWSIVSWEEAIDLYRRTA